MTIKSLKNRDNNIGQFATIKKTSINQFTDLLDGPNKNKNLRKKVVKHDIFFKIYEICEEDYWKKFFLKRAYGVFPKHIEFKDGELVFRNNVKLGLTDNIEEMIIQTKDFFRKYGNAKSPEEYKKDKLEKEKHLKELKTVKNLQFKDIKVAKVRESVIYQFCKKIVFQKYKYNNTEEIKNLYDNIKNSITLGDIENSDVILYQGEILTITNLKYIDNKFVILSKRVNKRTKSSSKRSKSTKSTCSRSQENDCNIITAWKKYNKKE